MFAADSLRLGLWWSPQAPDLADGNVGQCRLQASPAPSLAHKS